MAKVFAVVKNRTGLELLSWSSSKAFSENGEDWFDEKFIVIATTDDHKRRGLYNSFELYERTFDNYKGLIARSEEYIIAHDLLSLAFAKHFNKPIPEQALSAINDALIKLNKS